MRPTSTARGLGPVEAFVATGVLAVSLALVVPAIGVSREASRLDACRSKLATIGKGVAAFETAHGHLPRAGYWEPIYGGWGATLLPYVDQEKLAARYQYSKNWWDEANADAIKEPVSLYLCPATPESKNFTTLDVMNAPVERIAAPSDYTAPRGYVDRRFAPNEEFGPLSPLAWFNQTPKREAITDGLAHSLVISEQAARWEHWIGRKRQPDQDDQTYAGWVGPWASYNAVWIMPAARDGAPAEARCGVNCNNSDGFYSFHDEGANALMADGAVRTLSPKTEDWAVCAIVSRAGGEVLGETDY